jgi:hypothetical protein
VLVRAEKKKEEMIQFVVRRRRSLWLFSFPHPTSGPLPQFTVTSKDQGAPAF